MNFMNKKKYTKLIDDMLFDGHIANFFDNEDNLEVQIGTFSLSVEKSGLDLSAYTVSVHNELVVRIKEAIDALPKESADELYSFIKEKVSEAGVYSAKFVT